MSSKRVKNYNEYIIYSDGRVFSDKSNKFLKHNIHPRSGYHSVSLCKDGVVKSFSIHFLVASHFVGEILEKKEINHIDGNKSNNHFSNLEIVTHAQNMKHAKKLRLIRSGENHHSSLLTDFQIRIIIKSIDFGLSRKYLAEVFKVSYWYIRDVATKKRRVYAMQD